MVNKLKWAEKQKTILPNNKQEMFGVLQHQPTFFEINTPINIGEEKRFLLSSDRHWDNPHSDLQLQKKHLEEAKEKNAAIIDVWDLFCAMQGKYDKRASKESVRPEHQKDNYLDALINTATDWFSPYAQNFAVIGEWNHETAIRKRHETDLIDRFVTMMNMKNHTDIKKAWYTGWIRLSFTNKWWDASILLHFDHGYGWWGPVTKGTIQTNRRAVYLPQADIVVSWHIHEHWILKIVQEMVDRNGKSYLRDQYHVSLPTYKEEYLQGSGYHRENGRPPKPLWAVWLKVKWLHPKDWRIEFTMMEAK